MTILCLFRLSSGQQLDQRKAFLSSPLLMIQESPSVLGGSCCLLLVHGEAPVAFDF